MPRCKKENVYFLLDNTENVDRKSSGHGMEFWDNCGTWNSASLSNKTTYFVHFNGRLRSVLKKDSVYGVELKKKFEPLDPQPVEDQVLILKRFYATCSSCSCSINSAFIGTPGFHQ